MYIFSFWDFISTVVSLWLMLSDIHCRSLHPLGMWPQDAEPYVS